MIKNLIEMADHKGCWSILEYLNASSCYLNFKLFLKGDFQAVGSNRIEFLCFFFLFLFLLLDFTMYHMISFGEAIKCIHLEIILFLNNVKVYIYISLELFKLVEMTY